MSRRLFLITRKGSRPPSLRAYLDAVRVVATTLDERRLDSHATAGDRPDAESGTS